MAVFAESIDADNTAGGTLLTVPIRGNGDAPTYVQFYNAGTATVFLGGPGVTTTDGFPIATLTYSEVFELLPGDAFYGITAATTEAVNVLYTHR